MRKKFGLLLVVFLFWVVFLHIYHKPLRTTELLRCGYWGMKPDEFYVEVGHSLTIPPELTPISADNLERLVPVFEATFPGRAERPIISPDGQLLAFSIFLQPVVTSSGWSSTYHPGTFTMIWHFDLSEACWAVQAMRGITRVLDFSDDNRYIFLSEPNRRPGSGISSNSAVIRELRSGRDVLYLMGLEPFVFPRFLETPEETYVILKDPLNEIRDVTTKESYELDATIPDVSLIAPDGASFITSDDHTIMIWDALSQPRYTIVAENSRNIHISNDLSRLVFLEDNQFHIHDYQTGELLYQFPAPDSMAFFRELLDNNNLLVTLLDGASSSYQILEGKNGDILYDLGSQSILLDGTSDGFIGVRRVQDHQRSLRFIDLATGNSLADYVFPDGIQTVSMGTDRRYLAVLHYDQESHLSRLTILGVKEQ